MPTQPRLDAGLLVRAEHAVVLGQGLPSQDPAYKSRTRPAFSSKAGSRGNSQLRKRQGLSASRSRMRPMVLRLMGGASACAALRRANSAVL